VTFPKGGVRPTAIFGRDGWRTSTDVGDESGTFIWAVDAADVIYPSELFDRR